MYLTSDFYTIVDIVLVLTFNEFINTNNNKIKKKFSATHL